METTKIININNNFDNDKLYDRIVALSCGELDPEDVCIPWEIIYHNVLTKLNNNEITETKT